MYFRNNKKSFNDRMLKEFQGLSDDEIDLMLSVPILVSVLIAGADGNIDHKEKKEAILLAQQTTSRD